LPVAVLEAEKAPETEDAPPAIMGAWNRFGIIDFAVTYALVKGTIKFWQIVTQRM
jgi:hypothetical protein